MKITVPFRLVALPYEPFSPLFALPADVLAERHDARLCVADTKPGFPCRVSLEDAEPGERVLLLPHVHQPARSPYRATGAIFVREHAREASPAAGEVPDAVRRRLLSVRAYDAAGTMLDAEVAEGRELEAQIARFFSDSRVDVLHLHNARPGCYACRVERA